MSSKVQPIKKDVETSVAELPEGWELAALREGLIDEVQPGFACGKNNREGTGIAHLRPMNVSTEGTVELQDLKYVPKDEVDREERLIRRGDVLFNNTNSSELVGKTAFYSLPQPRAFSNHMTRLRCHEGVLQPRYCAAALHFLWQNGYFENVCNNHVSQASVSRAVLLETRIPLPPITEQARIVEAVDKFSAQVATSRVRLAKVPVLLKHFRQAVLAAACSGKLTEDWRREHSGVEPGAKLVERVLRDRKSPKYPFAMRDCGGLDIPDIWSWTSLDTLIQDGPQNGLYRPQSDYGDGSPIIRIEDYQNEFVRPREQLSKVKANKGEVTKYAVHPDDIVINRVNSPSHIGKCLIVPASLCPAIFESNMMRITITPLVDPNWVVTYLRSIAGKSLLTADAKWAVNQVSINQTDVVSTPVPVPPAEEQHEIVRRVEALFKLADAIEKRVDAASLRAEKLTQAILAKAFRGELVPTEAESARREGREYEPASVLLERIKKERGAGEEKAKGRQKGKARELQHAGA